MNPLLHTCLVLSSMLMPAVTAAQPGVAEDWLEERWPLQGARRLHIDLPKARLTLTAAPQADSVAIDGRAWPAGFLKHQIHNGTLHIVWQAPLARPPAVLELRLKLPPLEQIHIEGQQLQLDLDDAATGRFHAQGNQLWLAGNLQAKHVRLQGLQGSVELELQRLEQAELSLLNGPIRLQGASGRVHLSSLNGDLHLQGQDLLRVELDNHTGAIELNTDLSREARVTVRTLNGNIRTRVGEGDFRCWFETLTGRWYLDDRPMPAITDSRNKRRIPCNPKPGQGGDPGPELHFTSHNGNLYLRTR